MFCVTPSESVISAHTWPAGTPGAKPKFVAVATLLQVRGCTWIRQAGACCVSRVGYT